MFVAVITLQTMSSWEESSVLPVCPSQAKYPPPVLSLWVFCSVFHSPTLAPLVSGLRPLAEQRELLLVVLLAHPPRFFLDGFPGESVPKLSLQALLPFFLTQVLATSHL